MAEMFTIRHALWHIMGKDLSESIISDMGAAWAKVAACAELQVKQDSGKRLDHIDRWFVKSMDYENGKIDDADWLQAKEEFRQEHLAFIASAKSLSK